MKFGLIIHLASKIQKQYPHEKQVDGVWNGGTGVMFGEEQKPKTNNKSKKHSQLIN